MDNSLDAYSDKMRAGLKEMGEGVFENVGSVLKKCKALKGKVKKLRLEKKEVEAKHAEAEKAKEEANEAREKAEKAKEEALKSLKVLQGKRNKELARIGDLENALNEHFDVSRKRRRQMYALDKEENLKIMGVVKAHMPKKPRAAGISREENIASNVESKEQAEAAAASALVRFNASKERLKKLNMEAKKLRSSWSSSSSMEEEEEGGNIKIVEERKLLKFERYRLKYWNGQVEWWGERIAFAEEQDGTDACTSSSFSVSGVGESGDNDGDDDNDDDDDDDASTTDVDWERLRTSARSPSLSPSKDYS